MAISSGYQQPLAGVIGNEPPIETGVGRHTPQDRHRISLRWLSGTIMAGFVGAALIGAAVYTALDRQANFAELPVIAQNIRKEPAGDASIRKGDRLVRPIDIVAAKQTYRIIIPVKVGDREVLTPRSFTKVSTPLTLTPTAFADDVPKFDPLKLLTGSKENSESAPDQAPIIDAAEVSLAIRDLGDSDVISPSVILTEEEAKAQINEQLKNATTGANAALPIPPQLLLIRTSRAGLDLAAPAIDSGPFGSTKPASITDTAFSSIAVRMVPENVTSVPQSESQPNPTQMEERLVIVHKGEAIEDILRANQVNKDQISAVQKAVTQKKGNSFVREGQKVKLLFADLSGDGKPMDLARISVYNDETLESMLAVTDEGLFVPVEVTQPTGKASAPQDNADSTDDADTGGMRLYNALYETALKQELPKSIVDDLTVIFSNSVDFQHSVTAGDSFETLYSNFDEHDGKPELLYAAITAHNETFKFYRFQAPDDNSVDYYDENGKSGRKFLIRKPIAAGTESSPFGMRRHPIFGYVKMHTGFDWAAPTGTPVFAAGNGVILKAGWSSGYGRRVEIQHQGGYVTTYNHMSGFGRNIAEGAHVKQGQIVGYVGTTGNSTGAHLHYEVIINGHFVDPMGIRLPHTRELDGKILASFKHEQERVDDILSKAPNATQLAAQKN